MNVAELVFFDLIMFRCNSGEGRSHGSHGKTILISIMYQY